LAENSTPILYQPLPSHRGTKHLNADPAISAEIRSKTALAFRRLPPKLRIAAILAIVEELPHKQVAEALGISVAAVKVRVFRALRLLRKDLEQQGITP
jgi:RNA polymerase sigma-70 factor (ECF subfamily)